MAYHNLTLVACKRCGSEDAVKCGHIRGKQRFRCKSCRYTFVTGDERTTEQADLKKAILLILHVMARATVTELGRLFNMDPAQVLRWVAKSGFAYPAQNMSGGIEQVSLDCLEDFVCANKKQFDRHKPVVVGQGELLPGYNAMVIIQTPDGNKVKAKNNPFHEYRTLPYVHR